MRGIVQISPLAARFNTVHGCALQSDNLTTKIIFSSDQLDCTTGFAPIFPDLSVALLLSYAQIIYSSISHTQRTGTCIASAHQAPPSDRWTSNQFVLIIVASVNPRRMNQHLLSIINQSIYIITLNNNYFQCIINPPLYTGENIESLKSLNQQTLHMITTSSQY